ALTRTPDLIVLTKVDLISPSPGTPEEGRGGRGEGDFGLSKNADLRFRNHPSPLFEHRQSGLAISATTGQNIDQLTKMLDDLAFGQQSRGSALALNARHLQAIADCRAALLRAVS